MTIEFIFSDNDFNEEDLKNLFRSTADYQRENITIDADTVFVWPEDLTDMGHTRKCLIEALDYALRKGES